MVILGLVFVDIATCRDTKWIKRVLVMAMPI